MAPPPPPSSVSAHLLCLIFLVFFFLGAASSADPTSRSFSFSRFEQDPAAIALFQASKVVNGGSAIELSGQAVYEEPINVVQGIPPSLASFSTNLTFSLSGGSSIDGVAFAMAPCRESSNLAGNGRFGLPPVKNRTSGHFLAVEFDAAKNRVVINSGRLKVGNASALNLVLGSWQKLQTWIDYDALSRKLEVRLSKFGSSRPPNPFIAQWVDLSKMWSQKDVFLGLSSSNHPSTSCLIHSWSFELRPIPRWVHSEPLDPNAVSKDDEAEPLITRHNEKKNQCLLKVIAAMILGISSGALGASSVLYLWRVFGNRRPVMPEEYVAGKEKKKGMDCEYKKVEVVVVVGKTVEDGR